MARLHPTPQKYDSPNANPNGITQQSANLRKRYAYAAKRITCLVPHLIFIQITMGLYFFKVPGPGCLIMGYASEVCFGVCFAQCKD